MAYEEWNKIEDDDDDELQDGSIFEGQKDIVLFCIDCSESMHKQREAGEDDVKQTSNLFSALEAAMQVQKRKVIVGPNDAVGILLFNTSKENEKTSRGTELKAGTYLYQPVGQISAPRIQELITTLHEAREGPDFLADEFPPLSDKERIPIGDVFTSCNWAMRDGALKSGFKRIFYITDEDDPHPGSRNKQLVVSARTTLTDLTQSGTVVEPFFISNPPKSFDPTKFYTHVLGSAISEDNDAEELLPDSMSISRIDDLLSQMRFREVPKRAQFSVPFELANGFVIGVKGYGMVIEQKKGSYKYFMDLGSKLEVADTKTAYIDEDQQHEVDKTKVLYGMSLGPVDPQVNDESFGKRIVPTKKKVFFTAEEIKGFRTLGLSSGLKLLGIKDASELTIEDNVKHATFIVPDEHTYSGSKRTFSALLQSMIKKNKIGLVRAMVRSNSSPTFCALVPQEERNDVSGWTEPAGFHLIPYPFADDLRAAPIEHAYRASSEVVKAAKAIVAKLQIKDGSYPPDANPNPVLANHYAQLEASAFREEYDPEAFKDETLPKYDVIHKRAGAMMTAWKIALQRDPSASHIIIGATSGTKRKADVSVADAEIRSKFESGQLAKLRNDQLKEFLKSKSQSVSGNKAELVKRVADWLEKHP